MPEHWFPIGTLEWGCKELATAGRLSAAQRADALISGGCCPGLSWAGEEVDYSTQDLGELRKSE